MKKTSIRVVRGGSWDSNGSNSRVANRDVDLANGWCSCWGFAITKQQSQ
jgi:hypothetical protein